MKTWSCALLYSEMGIPSDTLFFCNLTPVPGSLHPHPTPVDGLLTVFPSQDTAARPHSLRRMPSLQWNSDSEELGKVFCIWLPSWILHYNVHTTSTTLHPHSHGLSTWPSRTSPTNADIRFPLIWVKYMMSNTFKNPVLRLIWFVEWKVN